MPDPVLWPFAAEFLHLFEMEQTARRAQRPTLAFAYGAALDRCEIDRMRRVAAGGQP